MLHFWYQIKQIVRMRSALFWALLFPVFLGSLFYFMFGNIDKAEQFQEIPVGVLTTNMSPGEEQFVNVLKEIKTEDEISMFRVTEYATVREAENALKENEIEGYITVDETYELTVRKSNLYTSIIKTVIDQYMQNEALIERVAMTHPEQVENLIKNLLEKEEVKIAEIPLKGQDKSPYTQYFYALLAMTCLIGSSLGLENGFKIQADLSAAGARRNVAPTQKMKQVFSDFAASYVLYCITTAFVLGVCVLIYHQDFGNNVGLILLGTWVGSFVGIASGTMIAVIGKGNKKAKEGLNVAFFMISSFLAGLQWADITYILEKKCPIINRINPATLIVNAYKSLAVYGDYHQYVVNLLSLLVIGLLFLGISILKLRRTKYASL